MKFLRVLVLLGLLPYLSYAQYSGEPSDEHSNSLRKQGQFFSVTVVRGEPLKFFVLGKEEAQLDLSKVQLTVRRLKPYPGKTLKVDRYQNYFTISESPDKMKLQSLEIKAATEGKAETLRFNLDSP